MATMIPPYSTNKPRVAALDGPTEWAVAIWVGEAVLYLTNEDARELRDELVRACDVQPA